MWALGHVLIGRGRGPRARGRSGSGSGRGRGPRARGRERTEDGKEEAGEADDVDEVWQGGEDSADEDGHARDTLECAEGAQRADGADDGVVAHGREKDRQPRERHHHKVELCV